MRTAQQILQDAKNRFNMAATHSIGCQGNKDCTNNLTWPECNHCKGNEINWHSSTISNTEAKYCAAFNPGIHNSSETAYQCPGHRNSKENNNRYPNPEDLGEASIIYARQLNELYNNIKTEINTRLNHIFYSDLKF